MSTTTNVIAGASLLLALAGCIGPVEIAPLPYAHPANPSAPAGTLPPLGTALEAPAAEAAAASPEAAGHEAGEAEGKYRCPMHAEVRSGKFGRCPICGMKLVERKDHTLRHEGHHER